MCGIRSNRAALEASSIDLDLAELIIQNLFKANTFARVQRKRNVVGSHGTTAVHGAAIVEALPAIDRTLLYAGQALVGQRRLDFAAMIDIVWGADSNLEGISAVHEESEGRWVLTL